MRMCPSSPSPEEACPWAGGHEPYFDPTGQTSQPREGRRNEGYL